MQLNLETTTKSEILIKEYLENNASETLADKINNGVKIVKDNKTLINKKTLEGFMRYAHEEARKQAEKGSQYACIEDKTVFGWAVHYFEEDSIEGTLYNEDGTEYKPAPKPLPKTEIKQPPKVENKQPSLFDLMESESKTETENKDLYTPPVIENNDNDEEFSEEEKQEIMQEINEEDNNEDKGNDGKLIEEEQHGTIERIYDKQTGEVLAKSAVSRGIAPFYVTYLHKQYDNPDYVIAYRLGDFYEVFGKKAVEISSLLDLTLTGRDCGLEERVPMVGFPYHVSEEYFGKIVNKFPLLIIENDGSEQKIPSVAQAREIMQKELQKQPNTNTPLDNKTPSTANDKHIKILMQLLDNNLEVQL